MSKEEKYQPSNIFAQITTNTNIQSLDKKSFGFDMNNLIGVGLQQIRNLCNTVDKSHPSSKMELVQQIRMMQEKVLGQIQQKICLILSKALKVVAVFDGTKIQKIRQIKTYIWQQKNLNGMTESQAKNYLFGKSIIYDIFKKKKYSLQSSQNFWLIFEKTLQNLIIYLKTLQKKGVQIFVAPYEADIQLVQLFKQKIIDIVVSKDKDYVNHGVPLLRNLKTTGQCQVIDVSMKELSKMKEIKYQFLKLVREDPLKRAIYFALGGSKHLKKLQSESGNPIPVDLLYKSIAQSKNLQQVFLKIKTSQYFNAKFPIYYKELAELAMIVQLASPYYNIKNKRVQCSEEKALEFMKDRLVNVENIQKIWNEQYNEKVKEGFVNIHTGKRREFVVQFFGKENKFDSQ